MWSDGPQPGFENFVRIFRVVLLFSCQGVADFFCAPARFILSRLVLFVNSFFYFFCFFVSPSISCPFPPYQQKFLLLWQGLLLQWQGRVLLWIAAPATVQVLLFLLAARSYSFGIIAIDTDSSVLWRDDLWMVTVRMLEPYEPEYADTNYYKELWGIISIYDFEEFHFSMQTWFMLHENSGRHQPKYLPLFLLRDC